MTVTTFQTVQLSRGKHRSPEDGACVMELSSMIAGEPFSDRPRSVCRVIAALLRAYNDITRTGRRQDLYRCASDVVGTRAGAEVEAARVTHCLGALAELEEGNARSRLWYRQPAPMPSPPAPADRRTMAGYPVEEHMARLARALHRAGRDGHVRALALVDELLALGAPAAREQVDRPLVIEVPAQP